MSSTKMGPFCPGEGGGDLEIYAFRLIHPIDILFRHLRYDVITWKREGPRVNGEFLSQRASNAGFDIFFYGN